MKKRRLKKEQRVNKQKKNKYKQIINSIADALLSALPFGNVLQEIKTNIQNDGFTPSGKLDWPRMVIYITTSLIIVFRILGYISNEDVAQMMNYLQGVAQ
jgi:hypothetical protein